MQVSLNSDEDYEGGRLIFATNKELIIPKREIGSITIHDNSMIHGVSIMTSGVRYGLFFCDAIGSTEKRRK